jgi:molybdopterin-guanine dinucleotide biosynthesis protein A
MPPDKITGFVLAGGQSRRMGRDKAQIPWASGTLLTHTVDLLAEFGSEVFIVGQLQANNPPAAAIPDRFSGRGPLGGIHAALSHTHTDWNLVLAVDLPLVTAALLGLIASKSEESSALAVVPRVGGRFQSLCAAYHRRLLPEVERAILTKDLSIHRLLERLSTGMMGKNGVLRVLEEDEIVVQGFRPEMLVNVNTPEDLERATRMANDFYVE